MVFKYVIPHDRVWYACTGDHALNHRLGNAFAEHAVRWLIEVQRVSSNVHGNVWMACRYVNM